MGSMRKCFGSGRTVVLASFILVLSVATAGGLRAARSDVIVARPGTDEVLGLHDCVQAALDDNDRLQAEHFRRRELDGRMNQALATGLPVIDATGTWRRSRDPSFALDETFGGGGDGAGFQTGNAQLDSLFSGFDFLPAPADIPAQTFWRASLNLNWTINPIKILGAIGAAGQGIRRQDLILAQVQNEVEEAVIIAYQGIILSQEQLDAVVAERDHQREFLDIVRLRFSLGTATQLDTLQAAVSVANIEPRLRRAAKAVRAAGARLNAAMGREPEAPLTIRVEQPLENDSLDRDVALELAMRRPDVQQAEVMGDLLRQNRRAQKADMRPYFSVTGSYGYVGKAIRDLDDRGHDFWNASVALNVPIFDGLLTKGLVQQTEASILRNEAERNGLVRQVRVDVIDLLDNLEAAHQNLKAAELNMSRAEELIETSTMMMRLGQVDYLTVLESESGRAQARMNLIQARYDVLTLAASLKKAVGVSPMLPFTAITGLVKEAAR